MDFDLSVSYIQDRISSSFEGIQFTQKITSLANSGGGKLIVGVNEKGKIIGVYPKDEIENISIVLSNFCNSLIPFTSEIIEINNKLLLVLQVQKSTKIAALTKENTFEYYFRIGHTICLSNKIIEKLWSYENGRSSLKSLSQEEVELVFKNANNHTLSQIYSCTNLTKSRIDTLVSWLLFTKKIEMTYINNLVIYQHLS